MTNGPYQSSSNRPLTPQQSAVFAAVSHYHEALGEAAPAAYVARRLAITHERVRSYFRTLSELGWLRGPASPAVPTRPLPAHGGLEKIQLGELDPSRHSRNVATASGPRTVEIPPLSVRADVVARTANEEQRTVELVFSTGAPVQRYDWMKDTFYLESLSLDPEHVRLDRLNAGGPLLDSHNNDSVTDQLGSVEPGSVTLTKKEARATVRFSRREAVEPIWQDVKDGIIRSVSVGYRAYKYEETAPSKSNALPVRKAIDWEPFEVSMVPIPADAGAQVRGEKPADTNPCQIVTRGAGQLKKEPNMEDDARSETLVETDPLNPPATRSRTLPSRTSTPRASPSSASGTRGFSCACRAARLPQSFADKLIADGTSARQGAEPGPRGAARSGAATTAAPPASPAAAARSSSATTRSSTCARASRTRCCTGGPGSCFTLDEGRPQVPRHEPARRRRGRTSRRAACAPPSCLKMELAGWPWA